jgi:hypothetical protein
VNIRFACPACERPSAVQLSPDAAGQSLRWQCPDCDHQLDLHPVTPAQSAHCCAVCGNHEVYKKKDFPHWLGLTVLTVSCLAFMVASLIYHQWWGWAILLGSAVFDGALYLFVRDVVVCYRCGAEYRHYQPDDAYHPFELGVAERYRQERLRRERLEQERPAR